MNFFKRKKKEGISLRFSFIIMLIVSICITVLLLIRTYDTIQSYHALSDTTDAYIKLHEAASSLLSASDYLTEEAQCYTVLGNRKHLDNYFEEAEVTKRREKAVDAMEKSLPESEALKELKQAMNESVSLMDLEYYGMLLVLTAQGDTNIPDAMKDVTLTAEDQALSPEEKKDLAEKIMHGTEYYTQKNRIRDHLSKCIEELKSGTQGAQETTAEKLHTDLVWTTIMIVFQSLVIVLILLLSTKLGVNPILRAVEHIKKDQSLPIIGGNEFRYLATTYNTMYDAYKKSVENLSYKASHDELTGLYNRSGYDLIKDSVDLKSSALLLFDADNFKYINDNMGHEAGDLVLKKIANVLLKNFRSEDYVCRIGGDEFVVMMVHVNPSIETLIRKKIEQINIDLENTADGLPTMSLSVGVALCRDRLDPQQVFHEADIALYYVKNHGRKGCCFYTPGMRSR